MFRTLSLHFFVNNINGVMEREKFFEEMKERLLRMKDETLQKIKDEVTEKGIGEEEKFDTHDLASLSRVRELGYLRQSMNLKTLKDIEEALRKIKFGDYGYCEECGEEIDEERLRRMPFTTLCVDCKAGREKEERFRTVEEEYIIETPEEPEEERE